MSFALIIPSLYWTEIFDSHMLETEEEHLVLDPGSQLKLYCSTNHSLSITWYKEDKQLSPSEHVHIQQNLLEIPEATYEDSGLYSCHAWNTGESLRNFTISVVGKNISRGGLDILLTTGSPKM